MNIRKIADGDWFAMLHKYLDQGDEPVSYLDTQILNGYLPDTPKTYLKMCNICMRNVSGTKK